ncbi:MAG: flagellar biosynthesis protein FlhF [Spirochaetes bacterium RBG_13_51_14]|nr:MAG: flagellar biosynthesis protein FlhF [Spirochaetes bacterium RBG_13_51_14]
MMKLKMEYGDDAIPISHKFVKEGGLFNSKIFAREVVELTAAVQERKFKSSLLGNKKKIDFTVDDSGDRMTAQLPKSGIGETVSRAAGAGSAAPGKDQAPSKPAGFTFSEKLNEVYAGMAGQTKTAPETAMTTPGQESAELPKRATEEPPGAGGTRFEKELEEIKRAIYKITSDRMNAYESLSGEEINIRPFMQILRNNDFDDEQCSAIITEMKNSISREDLKDKYKIEKSLKDLLKSKIVTTGPIKSSNRKKIVMFIGPTGVGKTTTMAKLGAINSLREGHSVAFVTIDNYRIAATEQLKKYAEIMNIPIHTVNSQREFKDVIAMDTSDIIMVDTSGRSHRNDLKISEIKSFADSVEFDCDKILCVSANTKKSDLNDVFRAFDVIHFNSIIITKVDETSYIGNVIDIADKYHKPISYYTNGQEVPNDIVIADPNKIVDMMIGNVYN